MDDQSKLEELRARLDSLETSQEIVAQRLSERMAILAAQVESMSKRLEALEARGLGAGTGTPDSAQS